MNKATDGELPVELKAFEARLAALRPRPERLDRDALLFAAGQASTEVRSWHRWVWPSAFGAMTTVAAALLVIVLLQGEPQPVVEYVYVDRAVESESSPGESIPRLVVDEPLETRPQPETPDSPRSSADEPGPMQPTMIAAVARNWLGVDSLPASPRQRQLESLLAQGADAMRLPSDSRRDDIDTGPRSEPQPYWKLRDRWLEGTITDDPSAAPTLKSSLESGAQS